MEETVVLLSILFTTVFNQVSIEVVIRVGGGGVGGLTARISAPFGLRE